MKLLRRMLSGLRRRSASEEIIDQVSDEELERRWYEDRCIFGQPEIKRSRPSGGIYRSLARDPRDKDRACDLVDCVRPSAFTVTTTIKLDVDIPGAIPSRLRKTPGANDLP